MRRPAMPTINMIIFSSKNSHHFFSQPSSVTHLSID